ncbi:glutamate ABC transporter substrate-binding protein [Streptomyces sp. PKU-EA00015]|uniref:glutamate ABC transporter substrate-binding protein n=1 Tax=Streptomyces sp. PKU-EA00015 TaxID=2748326 RepID=UPI0015A3597A|nr:glutamate ABC transporter substrate-binding protein [Streptomyces sp. PKU-EA00015]NWF25829.1 glutamate ABC transporter substrate-binding protein [Streptomyces sp. PKU-EA00015]
MKSRKSATFAAITVIAVALTATSCSGEQSSPGDTPSRSTNSLEQPKLPTYKVATDVSFDSPTLARAQKAGKLVIGVKDDQPFLGYQDANGQRSGFDIEIAKMVAADLGFAPRLIQFKTIDTRSREAAIANGEVDLYVGTYTINAERKKKVGFAGPYFMAGADLLVRKDDRTIGGPYSLQGKTVCSVKGATALREIQKPEYNTQTVETNKYGECVKRLLDGDVDAVTTDDAILLGYAAQAPDKLKVVGNPFTEEPYGIGMAKSDTALRKAVSDSIEAHDASGDHEQAYDATLGLSGSKYAGTPLVERY